MSTIRVDDVGPSAGGTTKSLVRGTASAWVNFDGTGTIAARDSENVSSLTDNGTGDYSVSYTNAMDNTNYSSVFGLLFSESGGPFSPHVVTLKRVAQSTAQSTTSISLLGTYTGTSTANPALNDFVGVNAVIHGDLA